jgi:adiponectin receptor
MAFFLALAFSGLAPLAGISILHSYEEMSKFACTSILFSTTGTARLTNIWSQFLAPLYPSFASYLIGFAFYATRWPECFLPRKVQRYLDFFGGGSHAIWHCFIVLAITQHQHGMQFMKDGVQCLVDYTPV